MYKTLLIIHTNNGDNMKNNIYFNQFIKCNVKNCVYYDKCGKCRLASIMVSGKSSKKKKETFCDSFIERL